jgi:hypothetical protein
MMGLDPYFESGSRKGNMPRKKKNKGGLKSGCSLCRAVRVIFPLLSKITLFHCTGICLQFLPEIKLGPDPDSPGSVDPDPIWQMCDQ